jgi:antitoxin PrlF
MTVIVTECRITAKGQTTVPKSVRRALGVDYGGKIAFRVDEGGVSVVAVPQEGTDPALGPFLDLLARDLAARPAAIAPLEPALAARITELVEGVTVDLDEEIEGEVTL